MATDDPERMETPPASQDFDDVDVDDIDDAARLKPAQSKFDFDEEGDDDSNGSDNPSSSEGDAPERNRDKNIYKRSIFKVFFSTCA